MEELITIDLQTTTDAEDALHEILLDMVDNPSNGEEATLWISMNSIEIPRMYPCLTDLLTLALDQTNNSQIGLVHDPYNYFVTFYYPSDVPPTKVCALTISEYETLLEQSSFLSIIQRLEVVTESGEEILWEKEEV